MDLAVFRWTSMALLGLGMLLSGARAGVAQAPAATPAPPQGQVQERDRLVKQVEDLRRAGKLDESVAVAERGLELERRTGGEMTAGVAESLTRLAELHELRGDWSAALTRCREALTIRERVDGKDHWRTADARLALAFAETVAGLGQGDRARLGGALRREQEAARLEEQDKCAEAERAAMGALEAYRALVGPESAEVARAWHRIGQCRSTRHDAGGAKEANERALAIRRKVLPGTHPDLGRSLNNLGLAESSLGNKRRAREFLEEAVRLWRSSLESSSPLTAMGLTNLGDVQYALREYAVAKQSYEQALAIRRKSLPPDHPLIADSLNNLGNVQRALREYAVAKQSHEQALAIRRKSLPPDHPDIATSLHNLGVVQSALREYAAAKQSHEQALAIRRKARPSGHPDIAWSLNGLGNAQGQLREFAAAKASHEEALAIRRKALPKDDPDTAWSLNNLGVVQSALREYAAAKQSHEQALAIRRKSLPADHPDLAYSLNNLGNVQRALQEYAAAKQCYQEALAIRRKSLPADHPGIAQSLNNLGLVQDDLRDYAGAKRSHEEALAIRRKSLPPDHPDIAQSLNNLGYVQWQLRDYAGAKQRHEEALAIRRKSPPKDHPDIAHSLNNLGLVQDDLRDYAAAKQSHEQALAIRRKSLPADHPDIAYSLNNLGNVQRALREYAAAKQSHEQALAIRRKSLPADHPDIAQSLNNLGLVQDDLRDYAGAKRSHEEALAIRRKSLPPDHTDIAQSLNNLGYVQWELREYAGAKQRHEEALAIRRKSLPADHPDIATSLYNLGLVQSELRDYAGAKQRHEEALAIRRKSLPPDHPDIAWSLNNLGYEQWQLADYAGAKQRHEEALAIRRKSLPPDHPDIATSLNNLGLVQWQLLDFVGAKQSQEEALAIRRKALPADHPHIAASLSSLGLVQWALRDYAGAKRSHDEALAISRKSLPPDDPGIAISLCLHGFQSLISGVGLRDAAPGLAEAADLFYAEQLRLAVAQAEQEQLATADVAKLCLHMLIDATNATRADPGRAYDLVVRVKGSVTAQQRWARQARNAADPETSLLLDRLRQLTRQIIVLSIDNRSGQSESDPMDVPEKIRTLSAERDELERQLTERSAVYRTIQARARVGSGEVRAALPEGSVLIDLVDYLHLGPPEKGQTEPLVERRMVAFVVRPDRPEVVVVPLGPTHALAGLIEGWRASYGAGKASPAGGADPGVELWKRLWEPLAKHLEGVQVVLVSPDGPLHGLPWAALPGSQPGTFLVHEHAFAVVPVPQLLPELLRGKPRLTNQQPSLLLAGGIDFGEQDARDAQAPAGKRPREPVYKPLLGTESEVNDLRTQFEERFPDAPAPKRLAKGKATKQAILAAIPSHQFVHLATHGFFADESEPSSSLAEQQAAVRQGNLHFLAGVARRHPGLLSGLVFAGVNRSDRRPEETMLTALEAAELELGQVELVVLSACDTGRGQVAGGEGVLGLQRAFQLAGARSVVASLWGVPDEETHQLMREFYRRVWSDKPVSRVEALRQAQLWMLENWKPRGGLERPAPQGPPPPYYWAAFVLSGDWR